jgi:hypothetical protein
MRIGRYFVGGLWAFGVLSALVVVSVPALRALEIPSVIWLIGAALLTDLALQPLAASGRIAPITMNERALGVIGGAILHIALVAAMGA